ncbi:MAG: hypothetical protein DMF69_02635 [Acidobacteria bacterium]|nr:MAG: hypothetical protein DMF69_02635 [Acidobacteriota bacterium]
MRELKVRFTTEAQRTQRLHREEMKQFPTQQVTFRYLLVEYKKTLRSIKVDSKNNSPQKRLLPKAVAQFETRLWNVPTAVKVEPVR